MGIIFDRINRIIEVEDPATEVTIQELLDAIRGWEDDQENMDVPKIADAAGKEILDESTKVGVTLKLLNWKVKFEGRSTPTVCNITGGNLVAVDEYGDPMFPVEPSNNVTATKTASSSATIVPGALTQKQDDMLQELYRLQGLDPDAPLTVTPKSRSAGNISQTIGGDGKTEATVTRDT